MSLVGVDVGSSSVKVAAFDADGAVLAAATMPVESIRDYPGQWEVDPRKVWAATRLGLLEVFATPSLDRDPPRAIAVSASGRENFLADDAGEPLSNVVMGADLRGEEFESGDSDAPWELRCGHGRERMDPVFRLAWWQQHHPELVARATYFFGWIDYINFRLCGRAAMDLSTASRYACFDLATSGWDPATVTELVARPDLLPGITRWGEPLGVLDGELAAAAGARHDVVVAQGLHDLNCSAFGTGVYESDTACVVSGSYENILVSTGLEPSREMLRAGFSIMPQPSESGRAAIAVHPTGNAVLDWARGTTGTNHTEMERHLAAGAPGPSPVLALPFLSGAMTGWRQGRDARGTVFDLTLATSGHDLVQAFMEAIVYDTAHTVSRMREHGVRVDRVRITGGGARSPWWNQLKADILGVPIDVSHHPEPGAWGAAVLAGVAIGQYADPQVAFHRTARVERYLPDAGRAALHDLQQRRFADAMTTLLGTIYHERGSQ